ncbi:hypothetical protein BG015_004258 [Linnemannia schmuckeri]|uniref:Uncharacterized protein n=1 Tax=Linnemannia schmuckeri TaxID=64567 RepID=A0A9P5V0X2_9FUNG|nr:hypothetical protein BG015_004258 [Linnemannia schmuckeri]
MDNYPKDKRPLSRETTCEEETGPFNLEAPVKKVCFSKDKLEVQDIDNDLKCLDDSQVDGGAVSVTTKKDASGLTVQESRTQLVNSPAAIDPTSAGTGYPHTRATSPLPAIQQLHLAITFRNVVKPILGTPLPKSGSRFKSALQLAYAHNLLPKKLASLSPMPCSVIAEGNFQNIDLNKGEEAWITAMANDSKEQGSSSMDYWSGDLRVPQEFSAGGR